MRELDSPSDTDHSEDVDTEEAGHPVEVVLVPRHGNHLQERWDWDATTQSFKILGQC